MEAILGEIRIFTGFYVPKGWAFCNGQILNIVENTALFSLLGTTYGGDGQRTFALPDLRGRVVVGAGQGSGLSAYNLGQTGGEATHTLLTSEMPAHLHGVTVQVNKAELRGSGSSASTRNPEGQLLASASTGNLYNSIPTAAMTTQSGQATGSVSLNPSGGGTAHTNIQPVQGVNFIIALQGIFPQRP